MKASAQELPSATVARCREIVEELLEKAKERRKDLGVDLCKGVITFVVSVAAPKVAISECLGARHGMEGLLGGEKGRKWRVRRGFHGFESGLEPETQGPCSSCAWSCWVWQARGGFASILAAHSCTRPFGEGV